MTQCVNVAESDEAGCSCPFSFRAAGDLDLRDQSASDSVISISTGQYNA